MSPTSYRTAPPRAKLNQTQSIQQRKAAKPKPQFEIRSPHSLVGLGRFELPTSRLSGVRSNQLSYRPSVSSAITSFASREFCRKKEPHFRGVRSVSTVDALRAV